MQPYDFPTGAIILTTDDTTLGDGLTGDDVVILYYDSIPHKTILSTYGSPDLADLSDPSTWCDNGLDSIPYDAPKEWSMKRLDPDETDMESNWRVSSNPDPGGPNVIPIVALAEQYGILFDDSCCDEDDMGDNGGDGYWEKRRSSQADKSCHSCSASNHVIEASGNLYLQLRPFELKGIGVPIEPVFTYNSKSSKHPTSYGRGWMFNYDRRIRVIDEAATRIECEDGRGNIYTFQLSSETTFSAKKRHHQKFSEMYYSGGQYIEEFKNGTRYYFTLDGDYGYLSNIIDRYRNTIAFTRDTEHKITSITDSPGRVVSISYTSGGKLNKIILPPPGDGMSSPIYDFTCSATMDEHKTPEGSVTAFYYNADYLMTKREHNGEIIEYIYGDPQDLHAVTERKRTIDGVTYKKSISYNREERTTTVTDEEGFVRIIQYDDFGDTVESLRGVTTKDGKFEIIEGRLNGWGADGGLIYDVILNGKAEQFEYDDRRNMKEKKIGQRKAGGGFEWNQTYTYTYINDNIQSEIDSLGNITGYEYDEQGNRTMKTRTVTDPDTGQSLQVVWRWTYYLNGLLQSETDPNGNVTTYEYDQYGNLINIQLQDAHGNIAREERMAYNALNWLKHKEERIDATQWHITDYTYDSEGRVLKIIYNEDPYDYEENTYDCCNLEAKRDRNGNVINYAYYASGKLWKETMTVGGMEQVKEFGYNGRDELASVKTYAVVGGQSQTVAETTYEYDATGRKTKVTDALGNFTDYIYNHQGRIETEKRYLEGRSITTSYEYDGYSRRTKISRQISDGLWAETEYRYDAVGRRTRVIDPRDKETGYEYDELNRVTKTTKYALSKNRVTKYRYDGNGNRTKVINVIDDIDIETTYTYNALNKVTSITKPVNEGTITTVTTYYEYDCLGSQTLVTDAKGNQTRYDYNIDGRLETVTDAEGHTTSYTYWPAGQIKTLTDANGNVTHYEYDTANRPSMTQYAYGTSRERSESYTYDNVGNMLSKTLRHEAGTPPAEQKTIAYEYDLMNRMKKKTLPTEPDPEAIDYYYDDLGRMISVTDENGSIIFDHDDANRLSSITYPDGKIVSHDYDLAGNRTRLTYTDATYVEYTYDDLNRMDQVKDQNGYLIADYSYNELRRTGIDFYNAGNAISHVSYYYNDASWITELYNNKADQTVISNFTYTHDEVGNRKTMTTLQGTHNYTYDNIYQLIHVEYPDTHSRTYNYDPVGNRNSVTNGTTIDYTHNELNEYTTVDSTAYTYDDRGNLTNVGPSASYSYDYENHLTSIIGSTNSTYTYDPFGKRIKKVIGGAVTKYIYTGNQAIEEWEGGALARKFIYGAGIDEPLVMETGGARYYYHFDALGSVRNLTNQSGQGVETYNYDVYGQPATVSSVGNPYLFTGRRYDGESDLYYYRNRYYSPTIGRFLQTDPTGFADGPNLYSYVNNDPINRLDPMGLCYSGDNGDICVEVSFSTDGQIPLWTWYVVEAGVEWDIDFSCDVCPWGNSNCSLSVGGGAYVNVGVSWLGCECSCDVTGTVEDDGDIIVSTGCECTCTALWWEETWDTDDYVLYETNINEWI